MNKSKCGCAKLSWLLLFIGGLNWGLVGIGYFAGGDWNVVKMIFGGWMWLEAVIYILVGVAAVMSLFGCKCGTCKGGTSGNGQMGSQQ